MKISGYEQPDKAVVWIGKRSHSTKKLCDSLSKIVAAFFFSFFEQPRPFKAFPATRFAYIFLIWSVSMHTLEQAIALHSNQKFISPLTFFSPPAFQKVITKVTVNS